MKRTTEQIERLLGVMQRKKDIIKHHMITKNNEVSLLNDDLLVTNDIILELEECLEESRAKKKMK